MPRCRVLLVASIVVLCASVAPSASVLTNKDSTSRLLRAVNEAADTEERGPIDAIKSTATSVKRAWKVERWASKQKSEDYVKGKLGIDLTFTGKQLENHPMYKTFEKFVKKAEKYRLYGWYHKDTTTYDVWVALGLHNVAWKNLASTKEFGIYKKYAVMFDEKIYTWHQSGYYFPTTINKAKSMEEMLARADVWIATGKSSEYVKRALTGRTKKFQLEDAFIKDWFPAEYQYYQVYLARLKEIAEAEKAAARAQAATRAEGAARAGGAAV